MPLQRLLPFAASLALLLPLAAQAQGQWPAGAQDQYMKDCQAAAVDNKVDAAKAQKHCSCGARIIGEKFTTDEIRQLNDKSTAPPPALRQKLMSEVLVCNNQ